MLVLKIRINCLDFPAWHAGMQVIYFGFLVVVVVFFFLT